MTSGRNAYDTGSSQQVQGDLAGIVGRLEGAISQRTADVNAAMADFSADGVSEEYRVVEQRWTTAASGSMIGTGRTLRKGEMVEFEFLCIVERGGTLVYQAMPGGRMPATDFTLSAIEPASVTFENPAHDFPKRIRYSLQPDGTLEAVTSGAPGSKSFTFRFKRPEP